MSNTNTTNSTIYRPVFMGNYIYPVGQRNSYRVEFFHLDEARAMLRHYQDQYSAMFPSNPTTLNRLDTYVEAYDTNTGASVRHT